MEKACCFTGYRPHRFAFSSQGLRPEQVQVALGEQIAGLYAAGCRHFISGMCIGVDLWAAEEVVRLQQHYPEVELIAAVPFEGQESYWSLAEKQQYRRLLEACAQVHVLSSREQAAENAAACYRRRNIWMVDHADTVLAVYSPALADNRSGTAATVRYARRQQRRLLYIHPQTLAVTEEAVHQLQFELP